MREGMKESTCSLLSAPVLQCVSQKPTAEIANVPRMKKAEGRGEVCGNCLSLPQSGIALETISLLLRPSLSLSLSSKNLCPREFQISFAEAETERGSGSRKFSMAKSSIIAVSSSISCSFGSLPSLPLSPSLPLWCQCGDEPKECSTLCGAPISSIKSSGGWHSNSSERERASEAGRQHM